MTNPLGTGAQIGLVAWLRWRLLRNSLRSAQGWSDLIGFAAVGLLWLMMAVGGAVGMAAFGFALPGEFPHWFPYPFWAVFLVWQLLPVVTAAFSVEFDFRNLLRFPLRFGSFASLSLLYGLLDPAALLGLVWLGALGLGLGLTRPELVPWLVLMLPLFALINLLLNRLIFSWLERLLARRRSREILFVVFLLAVFGFQGAMMTIERWGESSERFFAAAAEWTRALPPGLAGDALLAVERGVPADAALTVAGLGLYVVLFGMLLARRLRRQYRGEDLGESSAARTRRATAEERRLGWQLPRLSSTVSALVEKEVRYLLRNGPMLMSLVVPVPIVAMLLILMPQETGLPLVARRDPALLLPMVVGFVLLVMMPMAFNCLAFDGWGVQLLLVAPVRFAEVLLAKNLVFGALVFAEVLLLWVLAAVFVAPPGAAVTAASLAALVFALLLNFSVSNLLSLYYPRRFDFGSFRQRQSGVTVAVTLLMQVVLFGIIGGIFAVAFLAKVLWLAAALFLLLAGGALVLYRWSLARSSEVALEKREVLTAELCRT